MMEFLREKKLKYSHKQKKKTADKITIHLNKVVITLHTPCTNSLDYSIFYTT